jgi:hypothetical protein
MRSLSVTLVLVLASLLGPRAHAQSFVEMLDDARLFAEPDAYAAVLTTMPEESVAELLRCASSWCEVRFGDSYGYVRQRNLMATDRRPSAPPPAPEPPPPAAPEPTPSPAPAPAPTPRAPVSPPPPAAPSQVAPAPPPQQSQPPAPTAQRSATRPVPATEPAPIRRSALKSPATGTALLLAAVSAPTVGYLLSDRTADPTCVPSPTDPQSTCTDRTNYGPLFVGIGIAATAWVAGLIDAGAAARRANERSQTARVRLDPVASTGYTGLALRISL